MMLETILATVEKGPKLMLLLYGIPLLVLLFITGRWLLQAIDRDIDRGLEREHQERHAICKQLVEECKQSTISHGDNSKPSQN